MSATESVGPRIEVPFPMMTDAGFPHGLKCPTCRREIRDGQPYAERLEAIGENGDTQSVLTCVYCPPPGGPGQVCPRCFTPFNPGADDCGLCR